MASQQSALNILRKAALATTAALASSSAFTFSNSNVNNRHGTPTQNESRFSSNTAHCGQGGFGLSPVCDALKKTTFRRRSTRLCQCEAASTAATADNETSSLQLTGYKRMKTPPRFGEFHAIDGALLGPGMIERYDVYRAPTGAARDIGDPTVERSELVLADIQFGTKVNGHPGVVHGGIAALLFDDAMGFAYHVALNDNEDEGKAYTAYTANLNVNYRAPLMERTEVTVRVYLEKIEGRKIFLYARMESVDREVLYSEATSLYILARTEQ